MNPTDIEFLKGMLKAHDMEVEAATNYISMANENNDPKVIDLAADFVDAIGEASKKIKDLLEGDNPDKASRMDDVEVMSNHDDEDDVY